MNVAQVLGTLKLYLLLKKLELFVGCRDAKISGASPRARDCAQ